MESPWYDMPGIQWTNSVPGSIQESKINKKILHGLVQVNRWADRNSSYDLKGCINNTLYFFKTNRNLIFKAAQQTTAQKVCR